MQAAGVQAVCVYSTVCGAMWLQASCCLQQHLLSQQYKHRCTDQCTFYQSCSASDGLDAARAHRMLKLLAPFLPHACTSLLAPAPVESRNPNSVLTLLGHACLRVRLASTPQAQCSSLYTIGFKAAAVHFSATACGCAYSVQRCIARTHAQPKGQLQAQSCLHHASTNIPCPGLTGDSASSIPLSASNSPRSSVVYCPSGNPSTVK